ncbi:MAG: hypothetical protein E7364_04595 [Clostridiales bacterium]|nr:hypothetical protein [Clostridiales bacterium]
MGAKWITISKKPNSESGTLYVFKKKILIDKPILSFLVRVSADTRYQLFINGRECSHGPCQGSSFVKYYEEVECGEALRQGENEIFVKVFHIIDDEQYLTVFRGNKPALYFYGVLSTSSGQTQIGSDESFEVYQVKNIAFQRRDVIINSVPPFEEVYGEISWEKLECSELYIPEEKNHYHSFWGVKEKYMLEKRPIPMLKAKEKQPLVLVKEYMGEDGKYNIIFDAGRFTTAMLAYNYCADEGTEIKIIYTECAMTYNKNGELYKGIRDNLDGVIDSTVYDLLIAAGTAQHFEPFFYRAFRFIRVECSKKPKIFQAFAARYVYDFLGNAVNGGAGSFECSNEKYNHMWEISQNTMECTAHEMFIDCAFYEQQQYIGDGRFEAIFAWRYSNDSALTKKMLVDTAHSQQADGQFAGNYPNITIQILHHTSLMFVPLLREYLRFTGDTHFVRTMTGVVDRMLEFFHDNINEQGLTNPIGGCRFIDWVESWSWGVPNVDENTPMTVMNLMYAKALKDAAELCEACGRKGLAADYNERAVRMIEAINQYCYDESVGLYMDAPNVKEYCEHSTIWAIFAGAVIGDEARALVERTMTSNIVAKCSFSKNYDLLRVLDMVGCYEEYAENILAQWEVMMNKHCTTWCESISFERSECHGWSSAPAYEMSAMVLGVNPLENGFKKVQIRPVPLSLTYAKGRVPTPFGYIDVSWRKENGTFYLDVQASQPIDMEIICPNGKRESILATNVSICEEGK